MLVWIQRCARANADIVYSLDTDEFSRPRTPADSDIAWRAATESVVLLKNQDSILPIVSPTNSSKLKVAVIGANAKARVATGGGSAQCRPSWIRSPWEALNHLQPNGIILDYSLGGHVSKYLPVLDSSFTRLDGAAGFDLRHFPIAADGTQAAQPAFIDTHDLSDMFMYDFYHPRLGMHYFTEVHTLFTSPIDGEYEIGFCITGQGWLWIDDELRLVNATAAEQVAGTAFLGFGTAEKCTVIQVKKGQVSCSAHTIHTKADPLQQYKIKLLHDTRLPSGSTRGKGPIIRPGIRIGARPAIDEEVAIQEAVQLAKESDRAVLVVGLNADWESEGFDRPTLSLPGRSVISPIFS